MDLSDSLFVYEYEDFDWLRSSYHKPHTCTVVTRRASHAPRGSFYDDSG